LPPAEMPLRLAGAIFILDFQPGKAVRRKSGRE
jgi:hypothetical protein